MAYTYTKKLTYVQLSQEQFDAYYYQPDWIPWFNEQQDQGLTDPKRAYLPQRFTGLNSWTIEILASDQAQADAFDALVKTISERTGYQLPCDLQDVNVQVESWDDWPVDLP